MNEPRFHNKPLILETPCERIDPSDPTGKKTIEDKGTWAREIKLLESLIGMDPESDEFKTLEQELSEKGKASREKMQYAIDQKNGKAKKKLEKGQRSLVDMLGKQKKKKMESTNSSSLSDEEEVNE
jgi:AP endonuclease 1